PMLADEDTWRRHAFAHTVGADGKPQAYTEAAKAKPPKRGPYKTIEAARAALQPGYEIFAHKTGSEIPAPREFFVIPKVKKSGLFIGPDKLEKAAPMYVGPRGGKWADPEHTIPYDPNAGQGRPAGPEEPSRARTAATPEQTMGRRVAAPVQAGGQRQAKLVLREQKAPAGEQTPPGGEQAPAAGEQQAQQPQQPAARVAPEPTADHARVGVGGFDVPPPPPIPRMKGLDEDAQAAEAGFADEFERDPEQMAKDYLKQVQGTKEPNLFSTDDAKLLSPHYNQPGPNNKPKLEPRGFYNLAVHQTANAVATRAFLMKLDELAKLPEGDPKRSILVTSGGVAAGKGYALEKLSQEIDPKLAAGQKVTDQVGA
ncbi:MAG: hypothetical protein ACREMG_14705, partial [Gemmatimonadales bacterium]